MRPPPIVVPCNAAPTGSAPRRPARLMARLVARTATVAAAHATAPARRSTTAARPPVMFAGRTINAVRTCAAKTVTVHWAPPIAYKPATPAHAMVIAVAGSAPRPPAKLWEPARFRRPAPPAARAPSTERCAMVAARAAAACVRLMPPLASSFVSPRTDVTSTAISAGAIKTAVATTRVSPPRARMWFAPKSTPVISSASVATQWVAHRKGTSATTSKT